MDLEAAVRQAKIDAGLDPDKKYQPTLFVDHLPVEWRHPFWEAQVYRYLGEQP
jgi:hypothetical protein